MSRLTAFALDNPRLVIFLQLAIVLAGIAVFLDYPRREDPSITIREAIVTAAYPGMTTIRVEDLITRPLEERIRQIPEVKDIRSDTKTGSTVIHVVLRDEISDLDGIWQKLRDKMADARPALPEGTLGPFVNDEVGLTAVATIALWADGFSLAEMRDVAHDTRDRLYALDGIKKIEIFGVQDERIFIELSNARLAQLGIGPQSIIQTLQSQNIILPGGKYDVEGREVIIEPSGNFNDVAEIESVLLSVPGTDAVVPLADVAEIRRGYVDPAERPVYFNGRPAIVLSVSIVDGRNAVAFGKTLADTVRRIEGGLPFGYFLSFATFQPALVDKAVGGAVSNVFQSLAIVLIVVMVFLGFRTGLIVGSFVPLAMLMGLLIMRALDVEFQRMSIASLVISLGMLVDNGIVMAEDIRARLGRGEDRRQAVLASGRTLAIPLLIASLTTILAFAPIPLAVGTAGEFTLSLGQVVIIVLLSSWFLAMVSTTSLCYWFIKAPAAGAADARTQSRFARLYQRLLAIMLRGRIPMLALTLAALVAAGIGFRFVVQEFFPPGDRNQFLIYIDMQAGTRISATEAATVRIAQWLADRETNPEVVSTIAYVGGGGPRFFLSLSPLDPDPHVGFMLVNVRSDDDVPGMIERVRGHLIAEFPDLRGRVKSMWLGGTETGLLELRLTGSDAEALYGHGRSLLAEIRKIPGILDERQDWENKVLKIRVQVDQARARRAGVTSQEVALSLNAFIDGTEATEFRQGDRTIPLVIRGVAEDRQHLARLRDIAVYSAATGNSVPLSQIATFAGGWEFGRIKRLNQERTITIGAKHQDLTAQSLFARMGPAIEALKLEEGYRWELGGELEKSAEAREKLFANMPVCFLAIIALLIWLFNSFRRPAIILVTIPLTFIGAVIGLLVMNAVFGFMVILGLLSLAGIIVNNGIVLIDRIDTEREAGRAGYDAVITACGARLRPIVMTSLTTILGLLPLIVSRDPLFYGMASVIAFGLGVGTVLTLGVVPVLYTLLFRIEIPSRTTA